MRRTMAAAGVVLLLGACGSGRDETDSVRARSALDLGEKATFPDGETVAVHGYEAGVRPDATLGGAPDATGSFSVVDVEACAGTAGGATAEAGRFRLELPDGSQVAPASVAAEEPSLRTPGASGECNRGTVTFEVGPGARPEAVAYLAAGTTIRWRVT